jgi:hypothetical protein
MGLPVPGLHSSNSTVISLATATPIAIAILDSSQDNMLFSPMEDHGVLKLAVRSTRPIPIPPLLPGQQFHEACQSSSSSFPLLNVIEFF